MKKKKYVKPVLIAVVIIAAATCLYAYKEFNRKNKSLHDLKAVAAMQPAEILSQFANNEKAATARFAGKALVISGKVKSVDKDDRGFYTIALGDDQSMSSVRCSLDSTESLLAASGLTASYVSIKGICTGYAADELGVGADVILNRCVFEPAK